ncbi:hypothetical protein [Polaromonas sp.]|uniref:hypothetical protein n=1 Tax=Polaromonas sp. TaxID=1869339 RepID=UPI00352B5CCC
MKASRLWLSVYGAGFLVCFALLVMTLLTPIPYGDVTRVGRISETEFRAHRAKPAIPAADLVESPIDQADIVVIGDSFSIRFAWQSALVHAGHKVVTTHWDNTGPLCADLGDWLQRSGFRGKLVIVESIERLLPERLAEAGACSTMARPFEAITRYIPLSGEDAPKSWLGLNWKADWVSGWLTFLHTRAIKKATSDLVFDHPRWGDLIVARNLPDGCQQFSHRLCNKGLFLVDDDRNAPLTAESVPSMKRIGESAAPFKMLWMVIPNKTTVYAEPRHANGFLQSFAQAGMGPDLFTFAGKAKSDVVDLYSPNDTHLSLQGYLAFGEQMLKTVRKADQ